MKRFLIIMNVLFAALAVSPFVGAPKVIHIEEHFSLRNMPTSTVLAQLNIVPTVVQNRTLMDINTVNHMSKSVELEGVLIDMDAIHYMLYQTTDLEIVIEEWLVKEERTLDEIRAMVKFQEYLEDESLQYKSRFFRFEESEQLIKGVESFIVELFKFNEVVYQYDFLSNKEVRAYEVRFYEDFDETRMVAGIYGKYHVYDKKTYYIESDVCDEFTLFSKVDEEEKLRLIDEIEEEQFYEEEECYLYVYEQLNHNLSFELAEERYYPHEKIFVFDYQSHSTKPYARFRLVFDHFYEEKLMISSETMNFKISKEANDYRNQYNVEEVEVYGEKRMMKADMIYPHRTLIENKELWFYTKSNYFHQMTEQHQYNVKYRKDLMYYDVYQREEMLGGLELIYNSVGYVVYDPLTTFTFNYGISDMDHYLKDVYPFLLWGTSVENRKSYSMVERFIWDKDRFTIFRYGHVLEKDPLRQYYDTRLKNVIIGTEIPIDILDEIDAYYIKTR